MAVDASAREAAALVCQAAIASEAREGFPCHSQRALQEKSDATAHLVHRTHIGSIRAPGTPRRWCARGLSRISMRVSELSRAAGAPQRILRFAPTMQVAVVRTFLDAFEGDGARGRGKAHSSPAAARMHAQRGAIASAQQFDPGAGAFNYCSERPKYGG